MLLVISFQKYNPYPAHKQNHVAIFVSVDTVYFYQIQMGELL